MPPLLHLTPLDPEYPSRLRGDPKAPATLSTQGGSLEADRVVAIVGSRDAHRRAAGFAGELAAAVVRAGAVVVSGGAFGIDAAAHIGALRAGGRTWAVAGTGCCHCFPDEHLALFQLIADGPGAMIWPFPPDSPARHGGSFLRRNRILVALADAVVVAQAGVRSGAIHAARCARSLGKPLWVVPTPPWKSYETGFEGSHLLLHRGARPLTSIPFFLQSLGCSPGSRALSADESAVLRATSSVPLHLDEIAAKAHASAQGASAALLTLALENVVVEGPPGFFRRRGAENT